MKKFFVLCFILFSFSQVAFGANTSTVQLYNGSSRIVFISYDPDQFKPFAIQYSNDKIGFILIRLDQIGSSYTRPTYSETIASGNLAQKTTSSGGKYVSWTYRNSTPANVVLKPDGLTLYSVGFASDDQVSLDTFIDSIIGNNFEVPSEPDQPEFDFENSQYSNLLLLDPKIKGLILDAYSGAPSALISLIGYLDPVIGDEPLFRGLGSIVGYIMYPFAHSDYVSHNYDQMALGYYILTNQIVDGSSSTKPMNILKKGDKITAFGIEEQTITLPTSGAVDLGVIPVYYNQDTQSYVKGQMSVINNVTDNSVGDVIYADYSSVTINDITYNQDLSNTYIEYITNDNSVTNNISNYTYITNVPGEGVPGQDPVVDDEVYAIFDGLEFKDLDNVLDDGNDFWVDMIKNTDLLHILGQIGALMLQFWYFLPLLLGWLAWLPAWATSCLLFCSIIIVLLGCIHALKGVIET